MNTRRTWQAWLATIVAVVLVSAQGLYAQSTTARVAGTVTDETGAALPGVTVTIKNVETGIVRTIVTEANGRYTAPAIEPGEYDVSAELQGFQTSVRRGVRLTLGQELMLNLTLGVGQLSEQVVVTGESQLVETTRSTVASLVDEKQIRELPLNGRDFSELALTSVGVVQSPTTDRSLVRGMGTQFSVAGARPNMVSYLLDGTDIADQGGQSPGSAAGGLLGVETVREFQVITNNYSAEYGRSAGGIVSAITRSGTNAFRGAAFEFHRNDAFDSRTYFDDPGEPIPPLTRNQYGFNFGGPLKRDKTFFFGGFEGLRQDKGSTRVARVPSRATRARTDLNPVVVPYMNLFPLPNGTETGATGLYSEQVTEPSKEDYFVVKIDHTFSQRDSGAIRYTFDNASQTLPALVPITSTQHRNRNQYVTLEWKRLFSGTLLNDFRGAFNRTFQNSRNVDNITIDPALYFIPGAPQIGTINVTGVDTIGADTSIPYLVAYNVIQLIDNVTWTKGNHTVKFGGAFTRWINNQNAAFTIGGTYQFTSIDNFVRGIANNFESALPGTTSDRYWRQNMLGTFLQDDWAVTNTLTVNLGVRYEFYTTPKEKYDRVASFRNPPYDIDPVVGYPLFKNPSLANVAPRVGFAWNVTGDGKTAIRGGAGVFYEPLLANIYRTFGNRTPPFFAQASLRNPTFPQAVAGALPTNQQRLDLMQWDIDNPYMVQFNFTAQRELFHNLSVMAGYIGSRGINLFRIGEANQAVPQIQADGSYFFPVGSVRRSPNWAAVRVRRSDGNSWYNGFVSSVTKRFSGGLQFQASYTLGRSYDESSISAGSQDFSNGFPPRYFDDRSDNYGYSDFDVRHNLSFNYSWNLPFGEGATGATRALVAGWQLSGIVTLRSGIPFTPVLSFDRARALPRSGGDGQRPELAPGVNIDEVVTGNPEQWFDPAAFVLPAAGTFSPLGRNLFRGPGYAVWNGAVFKNFEMGTRRLQLRFEAFNLLNRANFGQPARTVFSAAGPVENAGEITDIVGTARQMQIGLKFEF